jgi:hypothetical protein
MISRYVQSLWTPPNDGELKLQCTRGQKRWLLWLCLTVVSIFVCYCYWHFQWHCVYCHHVSHQVGSQRIPCIHCTLLGVSIVIGVPQNRLFIMENLIKMDDLVVPPFQETSYDRWGISYWAYPCLGARNVDSFLWFPTCFFSTQWFHFFKRCWKANISISVIS